MKFFYSCAFLVVFFAACQASPLFGLGSLVSSAVDTGKNIAGGVVKDVGRVTSDLKEIGGKVTDINAIVANLVSDTISKLMDNVFKTFEYAGSGIASVEDAIKSAKPQVGEQLKNLLQGFAGEALNKVQDVSGQAVENKQAFIKEVQDGVSNLVDNFLKSYDSAAEGAKAMKENLAEQRTKITDLIKERVQKLVTDFVSKTKDLSGLGKNIIASKKKAAEELVSGINQLTSDVTGKLTNVMRQAKDIADKVNEAQIEKVRECVEGAKNMMRSIAEKFTQAKEKIPEVHQALCNLIKDRLSSTVPVIKQGMEVAVKGITNCQAIVGGLVDEVAGMVTGSIQSVANLAVGSINLGTDTAKSIVGNIVNLPISLIGG